MTSDSDELMISQSLYEREKRARLEAEAMLEAKKREIFEMNRRLMADAEAVRSALADTEAVRLREAVALKERSILSEALKALTGKTGADEAMQSLLDVLKREIGGRDCFFIQEKGDHTVIAACADKQHQGKALPLPASMIRRSRRIAKLTNLIDDYAWPGGADELASTMIVPLVLPDEKAGALLLGCKIEGRYSSGDLRTLEQVSRLAAQALLALREARRNALLLGLLEGRPLERSEAILDAPLEAVHKAFSRLTEMQGQVVGILDALLGASLKQTDQAIDTALAQMGELTATDRTYVFRLRPDGAFIDNTHEWCAPNTVSCRDMLQDIPVEMIDHWRELFDAGAEVLIPDVAALPKEAPEKDLLLEQGIKSLLAVPLVEDGAFRGFVGFDAVRAMRNFLPGEVHLIRSVAKVIVSVLARRDAEERLVSAHASALSQRARLEAVLSAMPDLIVELDREGRFISWHSGTIEVTAKICA